MDDAALARSAADLVLDGWGLRVRSSRPLGGGMNSATALVDFGGDRAVLKWVPAAGGDGLASGCRVARRLAGRGLLTGDPFPTCSGDLTHATGGGVVALLHFVAGSALSPEDARDQSDLARTLAEVHAGEGCERSGPFMNDVLVDMVHEVEPWVRPSVDRVIQEHRGLPPLTWSILHGDPETGAFLRQPDSDRVAVIDWSAAVEGPVLYDVASAVMYLGGRAAAGPFWRSYLRHAPAPVQELTTHLGAFTRYRAAVQAAYFSMRIGREDCTGIDGDGENWKGLRDAETMLRANGALVETP